MSPAPHAHLGSEVSTIRGSLFNYILPPHPPLPPNINNLCTPRILLFILYLFPPVALLFVNLFIYTHILLVAK